MKGRTFQSWNWPDDAEAHYKELLERTAQFRQAPVHAYAGYEGPWIENIFISHYIDKPLSFFNGIYLIAALFES